jgi:peptidoglycan/xylan/chitin deacetylase (PgdA/CDA1 family)
VADARPWRPTPLITASAGLHAVAAASLLVTASHWPWALGLVACDHLALTVAGLLPRSSLLGPNMLRLAPCSEPHVALTFDDGPDPSVTPRVLDLLERHQARASFFCIGERVQRHAALAREIVARGHHIENHSYHHSKAFSLYLPGRQRSEIERAQATIADVVGRQPVLFRAPAGLRNAFLEPILAAAGLVLVTWTRRGFDTVTRDSRRVAAKLTFGLAAGDILLLHDGDPARDADGQPVALEALEMLLVEMERRGLASVPVDEGLSQRQTGT